MTTLGGNTYHWGSAPIVGMGVVGVLAILALTHVERRAAEPILPPALFRNRVARTECLRSLLDDWEPDGHPELDPLLRRLAEELARPPRAEATTARA
ncbi:MAG TPA: hypothetical protein VNT03_00650 [Baekduia sp.]|nr:hypothetical protein [Baekduia sp.]